MNCFPEQPEAWPEASTVKLPRSPINRPRMLKPWTTQADFPLRRMTLRRRVWPESPHFESGTAIYETFTILIQTIGLQKRLCVPLLPLLQSLR